ncbi:hypothetical protein Tco_1470567 [Tanacetum coccineum]
MSHHKRIYVTPSYTKKILGNMKREGKGFFGRVTPLFQTMMVQAHEEIGEGSEIPTDPHHTPIIKPSILQPQKKQSRRKQRKDIKIPQSSGPTKHIVDKIANEKNFEEENQEAGKEKEVKNEGLGDKEDASKQGRKIADIDADVEVRLIDETQGRNDDNLIFDTVVLDKQEVEVEKRSKLKKPKVRGVMIQEPSKFTTTTIKTTPAASKPSHDKGKAKMIESEEPLKMKPKDQVLFDE